MRRSVANEKGNIEHFRIYGKIFFGQELEVSKIQLRLVYTGRDAVKVKGV